MIVFEIIRRYIKIRYHTTWRIKLESISKVIKENEKKIDYVDHKRKFKI